MTAETSDKAPELSVVMPVWNGAALLREAVESVLNQTFRDFEFLVLDDGSTDETPSILAEYAAKDSRVRIIGLDHGGIVAALNRGIAESRAGWVVRMDCDDISHPERLERQWMAVQDVPDAVLCHTQIRIFGDAKYVTPSARMIRSQAMIALRLCHQCPIVHPSVMVRKEAVIACGGYLENERHAEDYSLWGRLINRGKVIGLPQPLLNFRVHDASISKQKAERQLELSTEIALRHCRDFMRLSDVEAARALEILRHSSSLSDPAEWAWFISNCLVRLRWQSLEVWAWAAKKTIDILKRRFFRSR